MKKKLVAMLLAAGMVLTCLAGCGDNEKADNNVNSEKELETVADISDTETEAGEEDGTWKPDELTTVTWVVRCDPQDKDEEVLAAMNELLAERYNLQLEIIAIPSGEYNDRAALMISSGENFDLMYTASFTNNFYNNVDIGAFLPLNDLLESECAAELMEVYPEDILNVTTINGNIYAMVNYQIMYNQNAFFIRKDLAEKYGLAYESGDYVEDIEDLRDFMIQVRDNEEDLYVINEKGSYGGGLFDDIALHETFGSVAAIGWDDEDYEVYFEMDTEGLLEAYKAVNQLYHDGFVRDDLATVTDNSADVTANRYAIYYSTGKPGGDVEYSNKQGMEYIMVYKGNEPTLSYNAGVTTLTAINVNSKNPEAAMKMYNVFWTDSEIFNMYLYGLEGEDYTVTSDNKIEVIADSGYDRSSYGWQVGNQFNAWLAVGQDADTWTLTEEINRAADASHLQGFTFNSEPVSAEVAQISAVYTEYSNQYKYIDADKVDAWFEEFSEKLYAAGAQAVIDEVQKQIDEWRAVNGK